MSDERKRKLVELSPETLADALLDLAKRYPRDAGDLIERIISTPDENIQRFNRKLSNLIQSERFVDWEDSFEFSRELESLLTELEAGVTDPFTGVELVAAFFETDEYVFENYDDSSGYISGVYINDAKDLFVEYASRCPNKEKIAEILLKLTTKDGYGVRDTLIESAGDCLPEPVIRSMISEFQQRVDDDSNEYSKRDNLGMIASLASQIPDAKEFERATIISDDTVSTTSCIDIAEVYLKSGDIETAYSWLKKVPENEHFLKHRRESLLLEIYRRRGETEKLTEILYRNFRFNRSIDSLQKILDVIGDDKRDKVIADEVALILESADRWKTESNARFLISIEKIDEAEKYLIDRVDQLNGDNYSSLRPLAEMMEAENRNLVASLIYRSLLVSILNRGKSQAYHYGIDYLKTLDELAEKITDWKNFNHHEEFKNQIRDAHGRKWSFWSGYEETN